MNDETNKKAEEPETDPPYNPRALSFEARVEVALGWAEKYGVAWRAKPIDAGTHVIIPKLESVDLWAERQ